MRCISSDAERLLSTDQVGFWRSRSKCDKVAALTTRTENGFQQQLETGAMFLDLTEAYDTVWHTGLFCKLRWCMPYWFLRLVELLIRDRWFRVHIGDNINL